MPDLMEQEIQNKDEWEMLLDQFKDANFLQSWSWKTFQEALEKKTYAKAFYLDHNCVGACLLIKETAKRGSYLTAAGGPLVKDWDNPELLAAIFELLKKTARQEKCAFLRFRPRVIQNESRKTFVQKLGCKTSPMHLTADLTLQLDLSPSPDELLAQMRKSTRYEIRRGIKEEIEVSTSDKPEEIREFYENQLAVAKKHKFVPFSHKFLYQQFLVFSKEGHALLFHARKQDQLLASAFIIFYRNEAVYHYGISTAANRNFPGAHACQWAAILEAKKRGIKWYNFWGIAPEKQRSHRFASVSLFKRGFGGKEVQYLSAHDLPVSNWYFVTYVFELMRKKFRRL